MDIEIITPLGIYFKLKVKFKPLRLRCGRWCSGNVGGAAAGDSPEALRAVGRMWEVAAHSGQGGGKQLAMWGGGQRVNCPLHCKGTAGTCTLGRRKGGGLWGATKSKLISNVVL